MKNSKVKAQNYSSKFKITLKSDSRRVVNFEFCIVTFHFAFFILNSYRSKT